MKFSQSIKSVLIRKYTRFDGRASRSEFWYFVLFIFLSMAGFYALFALSGGYSWLEAIALAIFMDGAFVPIPNPFTFTILILFAVFFCLLIMPVLAVATRRFHDAGWSGWWLVVIVGGRFVALLLPYPYNVLMLFGLGILFIAIAALPPEAGNNKYGDVLKS